LIDNFEWAAGYKYRFGLYEVQYEKNLARVARPSAGVYADLISQRTKHRGKARTLYRRLIAPQRH
jgi:beta-glucosidase/6-phospho-beta-glucosidase/beta-galactosidase